MKRMLSVLWIPLLIELVNIVAHRVLRDSSEGLHPIDAISLAVTAVVLFYAGWMVVRKLNRITWALLSGILIWICSTVLILVLMGAEPFIATQETRMAQEAKLGLLLASLLSVPVVLAISALGAIAGRWFHPPPII